MCAVAEWQILYSTVEEGEGMKRRRLGSSI
jgi:hypothetical protein